MKKGEQINFCSPLFLLAWHVSLVVEESNLIFYGSGV